MGIEFHVSGVSNTRSAMTDRRREETMLDRRAKFLIFIVASLWLPGILGIPSTADAVIPLAEYEKIRGTNLERLILQEARTAIEEVLSNGERQKHALPWPGPRVGLFLTLMNGRGVRACAGTFSSMAASLAEALRDAAVSAVSLDPRAAPVAVSELTHLRVVVSFVGEPVFCPNPFLIDFRREGLMTRIGGLERLLLPGEAKTLQYGISRLLGISEPSKHTFERFPVVTLDERKWEDLR